MILNSFLSLLFVSSVSYAIPTLRCVTQGLPTTSFILSETSEDVELLVIHHNGSKYAPVYSGVVTSQDIDHIKKNADFFNQLGDRFTVKFKKELCKIEQDKFYRCSLREEQDIEGVKVDRAYFSTSESVDRIPDFEFTRTNVNLSFRVGSIEYSLQMNYFGEGCKISQP